MNKYSESPDGEEDRWSKPDSETGEILQIEIVGPESLGTSQGVESGTPKIYVSNDSKSGSNQPPSQKKGKVRFVKIKPLGAYVMATKRFTARQYQVLFMLIHEASYGGRCYTHPDFIGAAIGINPSDVRKALKVLEQHQVVFRTIMKNKGHCYILNPSYHTVGTDEEEATAQAIWTIERIKRRKQDEAKKPATTRA